MEVLNYNTYDQPMILFDVMGLGRPMDEVPMILQPGVLTMAWGSVVQQIAKGLDVELDEVEEWYERVEAPEDFEIDSGTIKKGTVGALHFEVRGKRNGQQRRRARARDAAARRPGARLAAAGRPRLLPRRSSAASPTTRSTCSCSAPTATTTRPA